MCKRRSKRDIIPRKAERGNPSQNGIGGTPSQNSEENSEPRGHGRRRGAKNQTSEPYRGKSRNCWTKDNDHWRGTKKTREELANYQNMIGRRNEEIQGLGRTIAGTGFSLGRLKREGDEARKGNEELEHRNHELRKELRRVGRRLLDLGN